MDEPAVTPIERMVTVANPQGIHMRIGKEIVRVAARYAAEIRAHNLSRPSPEVNVKSILLLMQLQAHGGHQLLLTATGNDAAEALSALAELIESAPVTTASQPSDTPTP